MLSHESLINYYKTNFQLKEHHGYSLQELDDMMPFEKEVYVALLLEHLEKEKNRISNG